ncbi:hypothetical protein Tsubulata_000404 [Turnera subulata]|uniref:UDP-glycosyltransferases domain-containing protein n=1 Tax=Turnera subulata TaxID=218843 RepID=A0A9Q0G1C5_9ROSI|nr:hypothetical protein Tsubulata_000404 [Turnera subulata]
MKNSVVPVSLYLLRYKASKQIVPDMEATNVEPTRGTCHVVVMPYPGRGHINPLLNLSNRIAHKRPDFLLTIVLTEEWHGFLTSGNDTQLPANNVVFRTIPNVIPSEVGRGKDWAGFQKAVCTKMEASFEKLLDDQLEQPADVIITDSYMDWLVTVGNRRNIPVASVWTMSATVLSIFHHLDLIEQNNHFPVDLPEQAREIVDYIPGVSPTRLSDFPTVLYRSGGEILYRVLEPMSMLSKSQYLLFTSVYELEAPVIDVLKTKYPFPLYSVAASIPCLDHKDATDQPLPEYLEWLNSQPESSVIYISTGSFHSVSSAQMNEIVAGVEDSGVRFLWVSRGDTIPLKDGYSDRGRVVSWCDQLRVLCNPAVGGFWTHCGWNSTLEGVYAGVPMLTAPIFWDQPPNCKKIVEDWKIGWRLRSEVGDDNLVTREDISKLVQRFMDQESNEVIEMKKRCRELQKICRGAIAKGQSSDKDLDSFIRDISRGQVEQRLQVLFYLYIIWEECISLQQPPSWNPGSHLTHLSASSLLLYFQFTTETINLILPNSSDMESPNIGTMDACHVVLMPYPGRGHINPMLNLSKLISHKRPDFLLTIVLTEEWHGFIRPESMPLPANVLFRTIPNVIPSELERAKDFHGFLKAVGTKMEGPFEQILNQLEQPPDVIVADSFMNWVVNVGNRRNIPVASLWPMSATVFSIFHNFELLLQNNHFPVELQEQWRETVDYIPGISSTRLGDFPTIFYGSDRELLYQPLYSLSLVSQAHYLMFTSVYELEAPVIDGLKTKFHFPVYSIGAALPCLDNRDASPVVNDTNQQVPAEYLEWLNSQPESSVLYISMGSFLSVSSAQMEEIVAGVEESGVRFLWVSRGGTIAFEDGYGDRGRLVPWCDQLRVLCNPAVGGFWTHCGWNSTLEAVYAGVPMLTAPIFWDQPPNGKMIVEDWKIGWRLKTKVEDDNLVTREEISKLVQRFMDQESDERGDPILDMTTTAKVEPTRACHVVAMPYPGRGHVNPMMNLCKLISSKRPDFRLTFVVTEEWLGFIGSDDKPENVRFATIPNVIPSERGRAKDFPGFVEAVNTKLEAPFEQLLDLLQPPADAIIADTFLGWMPGFGNRRRIPVASLWTMPATVFSVLHHVDLLVQNNHFPVKLADRGEELVDYIPGVPVTRLADLPTILFTANEGEQRTLRVALECVRRVSKAQYLLCTSVYELEAAVIDSLQEQLHFSVYTVGPTIPYLDIKENSSVVTSNGNMPPYIEWLNSQPEGSVLYISMGSYLSISRAQMDEIVAGVQSSGVKFLWVSREETTPFEEGIGGVGLVVPWCDQLRVLCHPAVGGFWTHCGWNSTLEAVFAGVPMLTSPLFADQVPNSKRIVEDWKIGWRALKRAPGVENLVRREEIAELVRSFMDQKNGEASEMRERAKELKETCRAAIAKGGSSDTNLDYFIKDISQVQA